MSQLIATTFVGLKFVSNQTGNIYEITSVRNDLQMCDVSYVEPNKNTGSISFELYLIIELLKSGIFKILTNK